MPIRDMIVRKPANLSRHDFNLFMPVKYLSMLYDDAYVESYADPQRHDTMTAVTVRSVNGVFGGVKVMFPGQGRVIFQDQTSEHSMVFCMDTSVFKGGLERDKWAWAFRHMVYAWDEYEASGWSLNVYKKLCLKGYLGELNVTHQFR